MKSLSVGTWLKSSGGSAMEAGTPAVGCVLSACMYISDNYQYVPLTVNSSILPSLKYKLAAP